MIHSLDRLELAAEIQKQAERKNLKVDALIQVNTTGEETKAGFHPEEVEEAVAKIKNLDRFQIRGLMTIGPTAIEENGCRMSFRTLRTLRDSLRNRFSDLDLSHLSMGMSSDFEWAIEEGATLVRIGTAVFGERKL